MMNNRSISVSDALDRLKNGKIIEGFKIEFAGAKVKAMDAFRLGKVGVDVPDEVIVYDDADIAYDPEFDDHEWQRTDEDPVSSLREKRTVAIEIAPHIDAWILKEGISLAPLLEKLIQDFYSSHQLIKGG